MSRFDRQSFLGPRSEETLRAATIGIVGLGGGGSHIVQQTGHLGIGGYVLADPDHITETNTNRLIGGTLADLATPKKPAASKTFIGERLLRGLMEKPRIIAKNRTWHDVADELKACDVIIGGVDSFKEREQLERFARRHLIPYLDIGMDVYALENGEFLISGQVFLSTPGKPCMSCCGLITEERLTQEAKKYGDAGSKPQVVWSNGVLASTAVGLLTALLTPWHSNVPEFVYLDYDGNLGTLAPNARMTFMRDHQCPHHPANEVGDPLFDIRDFNQDVERMLAARATTPNQQPSLLSKLKHLFSRVS